MIQKKRAPSFAATLAEIEELTARLEGDDTSLEQSLQDFEKGVQLIRDAQEVLRGAEQKVQKLLEQNGEPTAVPLAGDQDRNIDEEDL